MTATTCMMDFSEDTILMHEGYHVFEQSRHARHINRGNFRSQEEFTLSHSFTTEISKHRSKTATKPTSLVSRRLRVPRRTKEKDNLSVP